jgi:hypothetical protein
MQGCGGVAERVYYTRSQISSSARGQSDHSPAKNKKIRFGAGLGLMRQCSQSLLVAEALRYLPTDSDFSLVRFQR